MTTVGGHTSDWRKLARATKRWQGGPAHRKLSYIFSLLALVLWGALNPLGGRRYLFQRFWSRRAARNTVALGLFLTAFQSLKACRAAAIFWRTLGRLKAAATS